MPRRLLIAHRRSALAGRVRVATATYRIDTLALAISIVLNELRLGMKHSIQEKPLFCKTVATAQALPRQQIQESRTWARTDSRG